MFWINDPQAVLVGKEWDLHALEEDDVMPLSLSHPSCEVTSLLYHAFHTMICYLAASRKAMGLPTTQNLENWKLK